MKTPLDQALNEMTTLLSRDHSEKDWKWAVLRVLRAMSEAIPRRDEETNIIMARIKEKNARYVDESRVGGGYGPTRPGYGGGG